MKLDVPTLITARGIVEGLASPLLQLAIEAQRQGETLKQARYAAQALILYELSDTLYNLTVDQRKDNQ